VHPLHAHCCYILSFLARSCAWTRHWVPLQARLDLDAEKLAARASQERAEAAAREAGMRAEAERLERSMVAEVGGLP
jgi:hypothetical protein